MTMLKWTSDKNEFKKSYPNRMHLCRPGRKHVQSFEKTGLKLY